MTFLTCFHFSNVLTLLFFPLYFTPFPIGEQSIVMTMFCACYLWPWLGPAVAALRYVMYFRFYG